MPYYTCGVMFGVPRKLDVAIEYYHINSSLEPETLPELQPGEAFLYTNYFGLNNDSVKELASHFGSQLIVDNSQAFYAARLDGIDTFYSPRKYFGVPDGGYLYTEAVMNSNFEQADSLHRTTHLLKRWDSGPESGYQDFKQSEDSLYNAPIQQMSNLTAALLNNIDYDYSAKKRKENFNLLAQYLDKENSLNPKLGEEDVPMVYPFLTSNESLRNRLIANRVFIPRYWEPTAETRGMLSPWEESFSERLLPLPIDQRYGSEDMFRIIDIIEKCIKVS